MAVALAAGAILPLSLLFGDGFTRMGRVSSFLEWIWITAVLTHLLPGSGAYWPGTGSKQAVPLVLLAMAALSGEKERSGRICCALFWMAAAMLAAISLAAVGKVETQWLAPEPGEWNAGLIITLLLPALTGALLPETKGKTGVTIAVGALAIGFAALLQGTLSTPVARSLTGPVYELGRSIGNGGFEILVSVAMTLGWYTLCAMLLQVAAVFAGQWGLKEGGARILASASSAVMLLFGLRIDGRILTGTSLVMWILMPMLFQKNKSKKGEKSA